LKACAQDKIIAVVNSDIITQKDLDDFLNFMRMQLSEEYQGDELEAQVNSIKAGLLERLIEDRLILQEAKRTKINVDESRVKSRIDALKKQYESDTAFQEALAKQGLVQADLEKRIREQLLMFSAVETFVRSKVIVTPAEITDYYQEHAEEFSVPLRRRVSYVVCDNKGIADELYGVLKKDPDLDKYAIKFGLTPSTLEVAKDGSFRKEIEEVVFNLNIQEVSKPTLIEGGYYIFELQEIIPAQKKSLAQAQEQIRQRLYEKKLSQRMESWIAELRSRSYIKVSE